MIIYEKASPSDFLQLKALWKEVFDEEEPFLELFFAKRIFFEHIFLAREEDTILGALHALPSSYHHQGVSHPCSYIVGAATAKKYRGRGVMGELLKKTIESYTHPVTLFPAVRPYYAKRGFLTTSATLNYPLTHPRDGSVDSLSLENGHLNQIYIEATKEVGALARDEQAWQFLKMGYEAIGVEDGYALLLGDKAVEAMALTKEGARKLLTLLHQRGIKSVQILEESPILPLLLANDATIIPMGMSSSPSMEGIYIAEQY